MRRRVKAIALATESVGFSSLLPLAAGMLIALFAVSLAMAEPTDLSVVASHQGDVVGFGLESQGGLESDATADTAIASHPVLPPRYPDRYEFYHRYDHGLTSRYNPLDDGIR